MSRSRCLPALLTFVAPLALAAQAAAPTEVRFPAGDSLVLVADVHRAGTAASAPVILLFHQGGGSARGEYADITPRLLAEGYHVVAAEVRGGGDRFGVPSRAPTVGEGFRYCEAVAEVSAAVDLARRQGLTGPVVLWGSSYTAALVLQVAASRPADVRAVLAFSPASGEPMRGCEPEPYTGRLARAGIPTLVLRPRAELDDSARAARLEGMRRDGAQVFVAEDAAHGSSMLVAERNRGSTAPQWSAVLGFLRSALAARPPSLTYLGNEGVLLRGAGGIVLIDALFGEGLPDYATVPDALRDSLERARAGFDGRALLLITHPHRDHYDSAAVARYLAGNAKARTPGAPRVDSLPAPVELEWVAARALPIPHGRTVRPVGHAAWLVTLDGLTALHLGDTSSEPDTWPALGLPSAGVDLALVPYWYALDDRHFARLVELTRAATIVLLHLPLGPTGDRLARHGGLDSWTRAIRARYPQVQVPAEPGTLVPLQRRSSTSR